MTAEELVEKLNEVGTYRAKVVRGSHVAVREGDKGFMFSIGQRCKKSNLDWVTKEYLDISVKEGEGE